MGFDIPAIEEGTGINIRGAILIHYYVLDLYGLNRLNLTLN